MSPQQATLRSLRLVIPPHRAEHQSERDRRVHHRCMLAELPWLREVRLKYGPRAVLIDLSGGGAQLETAGYRLNPGSIVVVEINGNQDESPIPSRVIRCQIAGLAPQPIYRSALQFKRILALPASAACHHPLGADANPAREHARLLHALRRLDAARSCWSADAHFLALVREIAEKRHAAEQAAIEEELRPAEETTAASTDGPISPTSRVVVRYLDGRLLKGYVPHFVPDRGAVEVWPSPDAPSTSRVTVPFGQLKAIFFVRDFDGGASYQSGKPSKAKVCGRRVAVTFLDGEELAGATLNYQTAGPGFFVHPLDDRTNNTRVYVLTQSIRHVKFPGLNP